MTLGVAVSRVSSANGEPAEEKSVLLEQVAQFEFSWPGQLGAGEHPRAVPRHQPGGKGQAQLVEQSGFGQLGVEPRSTLEQHRAVSQAVQVLEEKAGVDSLGTGHREVGDLLAASAGPLVAVSGHEDDGAVLGGGEERR